MHASLSFLFAYLTVAKGKDILFYNTVIDMRLDAGKLKLAIFGFSIGFLHRNGAKDKRHDFDEMSTIF